MYGWRTGAILWAEDRRVCCEGCLLNELIAWSGLWMTGSPRDFGLGEGPVIGLSVSPWDDKLIFSSIFLSQNTSYARVLAWMEKLAPFIIEEKIERVEQLAAELGSYQVRLLPLALRRYIEARLAVYASNIWAARRILLTIPHVGVKIAHAHLLFTMYSGFPFPVDRHLRRMVGGNPVLPDKRLCKSYPCPRCPHRDSCTVWRLYKMYGLRAGLYQTLVWLQSQTPSAKRRLLERILLT
ncbi:hypothetical protein Pyrfu_0847 [Pyrolobus fumarii 1A]|uniref:HhH-GPD family protein n=1 Tax=Pyrolobus fumarii (strain DSM 11204 / 1A) TaxID=694429 RepID=G0EDU7_PYRF1|nr:hypothetical protein Pyrfu_0847 [Pyrolobus fumarii 1A]